MINKYKTKVVKFHHVETPLYLRILDKIQYGLQNKSKSA
ncbi:hypothetical protein CLV62_11112 [Dysgonomonas alginatilytica]|uniref:Uncharacterized protein n=1 Tax=Dysgonomonas alginatilytica TaxID=1605892 RepID=A0A2V3PNJ7_9BACT|nr:hypothetical protein CLV62_11112 [Dysgonomonas alginatilytica]